MAEAQIFSERSYAKVNLFLHVLGRLPKGYHTLESLVYFPQNYFDELNVSLSPSGAFELSITGSNAHKLNNDFSSNIISKAINLFDKKFKVKTPPLKIELTKNLFVAGGIGGGSGNAAAMIRLLNNLHGLSIPESKLAEFAVEIGADVPVCIYQRPAIFRGIGDEIELLDNFPILNITLLNPGVTVDTVDVFKMGFSTFSEKVDFTKYDMSREKDVIQLLSDTGNDLQPNALKIRPEIEFLLEEMSEDEEYKFVGMSGSGGTCFGIK